MDDLKLRKMAQVLVNYSLDLQAGELLTIESEIEGLPLVEEVYSEALRKGCYPHVRLTSTSISEAFFNFASNDQLRFTNPFLTHEVKMTDATLIILAPSNTRSLSNVPAEKLAAALGGTSELHILQESRIASGELRACGVLFPTISFAQDACLSKRSLEEIVLQASFTDDEDPVGSWRAQNLRQETLARTLNQYSRLKVRSYGTDLSLEITGRTWLSGSGQQNFPDGEVFTSPIETSAEGYFTADLPTIHSGHEVRNAKFYFSKGRVTHYEAELGTEFLREALALDEGARILGEVGFGLNEALKQPTHSLYLDEKMAGTVHFALGAGFSECGGTNVSSLHLDLLHDLRNGAEITADGQVISRNGKFLI